jgi:hypothetical protein
MNTLIEQNLRYQDIVARVSGINLKSVVRVLRALEIVAESDGKTELADYLTKILEASAYNNGEPCRLDSRPCDEAIVAGDIIYAKVLDKYKHKGLRELHELKDCPYYKKALEID